MQGVEEDRRFDVINLDGYDVTLGTPFLFQHQEIVGSIQRDSPVIVVTLYLAKGSK